MKLKGSKTEENLKAAFAGESQANRRYLYFANKADIEGQNDVAALFRSTAEGETGHAHGPSHLQRWSGTAPQHRSALRYRPCSRNRGSGGSPATRRRTHRADSALFSNPSIPWRSPEWQCERAAAWQRDQRTVSRRGDDRNSVASILRIVKTYLSPRLDRAIC